MSTTLIPISHNTDFINRALQVTSFNLYPQDFITDEYKKEIQYIFSTRFFPTFDTTKIGMGIDKKHLNSLISELKTINRSNFNNIFKYNLNGIGPGEVLLYFLINDAVLGGGSSAGADLILIGKEKYEIKAVDVTSDGYVSNFKLGGTLKLGAIMSKILDLGDKSVNHNDRGESSGANTSVIRAIRNQFPIEWNEIDIEFKNLAYNEYFKHHSIIFMRNGTKAIGDIISIQEVTSEDIEIDRVTSGTIKPKVKIQKEVDYGRQSDIQHDPNKSDEC